MSVIRLDLSTRAAVVTLSHPVGNRINFEMRGELLDAFEQVAASDARVLVYAAKGMISASAATFAIGLAFPLQRCGHGLRCLPGRSIASNS